MSPLVSPSRHSPRDVARPWALLIVAGAGAWIVTLSQARSMGAGPGTMGMAFPLFVGLWVAMMAAMMLPALGPAAAGASRRVSEALGFGLGFLVPWAVYGAAAFGACAAAERLLDASPAAAKWLGVSIFAVAGVYQFSRWKMRAIDHCRMASHERSADGSIGGFAAGLREGTVCVGCCWALMAILIAVGAMNVTAMAGLAVVIFAEKILPAPRRVAAAAGIGFIVLAIVAAFHPALLHGLSPLEMGAGMQMGGM